MVVLSRKRCSQVATNPRYPHIILHCLSTESSCCLSAPLKHSLNDSYFAMELAVIGHCFESDLRPVRRIKAFQAFLLKWVKSIPLTVCFIVYCSSC